MSQPPSQDAPKGFDDFELRLGDILRGERATQGKSLLDVQRELKIKASYIAAIENCDPSAFETPGFIAGYVRSYARYLNLDPEQTYAAFCAESGFSTPRTMTEKTPSGLGTGSSTAPNGDIFARGTSPFAPQPTSIFANIEPAAVGSVLVLLALIGGIGYGGLSVLREVQRVQLAPVEQTPVVLSDLDPLQTVTQPSDGNDTSARTVAAAPAGAFTPPGPPTGTGLDRLYRPQTLDVPVLIARDAPISTLDPTAVGTFAEAPQIGSASVPQLSDRNGPLRIDTDSAVALALGGARAPERPITPLSGVSVVAVRPAWIQITQADGSTLFEGVLNAGQSYAVPDLDPAPQILTRESGAIYFAANGTAFGPAGPAGTSTANIPLSQEALTARYAQVNPALDPALQRVVAEVQQPQPQAIQPTQQRPAPPQPRIFADSTPGVTILAAREAWVRVRSPSGATLYEAIMQPGDTYTVPQTDQPPTIRTGDAGAIYFAIQGQTYGPYGGNGQVADNLALSGENLRRDLAQADITQDPTLARVVAEMTARLPANQRPVSRPSTD